MNKIQKIIKKIRISTLKYYHVFGLKNYKKRIMKVYSKYNVEFLGEPDFIASNAIFDLSDQIKIGGQLLLLKFLF